MTFQGKVGLVQRVLPNYRAPFFSTLGKRCQGGLGVFAGLPKQREAIKSVDHLNNAQLTLGINWHFLNGAFYLCLQGGLLAWLRVWNPDVLIMEANPRYINTPSAVRWMHRNGRPVIGWGLGAPPISGFFASLRRTRRQQFIQQFDVLITYSQTGAAEYARMGFPREKIFTAVNAVTPPPTHPMPERPEHLQDGKATVLFVGRLQPRKKLDNLIAACSTQSPELQPHLVIVGDGPDRQRLESLAVKVYPDTTFTGALYGDALEAQFLSADLFVLPGTGGLAIQQAMSYGLPIIAAEADGTQGDLVRGANGWQIPPDNLPALTRTLKNALADIPRLRQMGHKSYRVVAEEINLEEMTAVFVQALKRSIA